MAHQKLLRVRFIVTVLLSFTAAALSLGLTCSNCFAGWLIYHKPALEGKVIDAETKEPLQGAVVVALYYKGTLGLGAGTLSSAIKVRETETDEGGEFHFPPYTTIIQPFSWASATRYFIYKPGYVSLVNIALEGYFVSENPSREDWELPWPYNQNLVVTIKAPNIVEIPKTSSKEERLKAIPPRDIEIRKNATKLMLLISSEKDLLLKEGGLE